MGKLLRRDPAIHRFAAEEAAYYFIANLHALTTVREPQRLRELTLDAAIDLLALGLDPNKAILFVQSDVPEVSELCWLLMTGAPMGLLERCHAYKDKKAKGLTADAGLFTYPVLMAADILAYGSDTVPVGEDQVQHIEVCRDLAASFNHQFGEVFKMPKAKLLDASKRKCRAPTAKRCRRATTTRWSSSRSQRRSARKSCGSRPTRGRWISRKSPTPIISTSLYSLVATDAEREAMAALYRRGGFGYGEVKKALADAAERYFAEARERRKKIGRRSRANPRDFSRRRSPSPPQSPRNSRLRAKSLRRGLNNAPVIV